MSLIAWKYLAGRKSYYHTCDKLTGAQYQSRQQRMINEVYMTDPVILFR